MGYTINSVILAMKLKSIKFIFITISKNLIYYIRCYYTYFNFN